MSRVDKSMVISGLAARAVVMAGLVGTAAAQPLAPGLGPFEGGPRIEVAEAIHDFGKIPPGETRQHEFVYRNLGSEPLEVKQVRTSCGCTTTGEWDRRVEPGESGRVAIKFSSGSYSGVLQRNVTLVTNDPRQPQLVLQVKAQIWAPFEVNPKTVMFQYDPDSTEGQTRVVRVTNQLDEPMAIVGVQSGHPGFAATIEAVNPGREFELSISTVPPVGRGTVSTAVTLEPADTNLAPVRVMAYAVEQRPLTVSPISLVLPAGPVRAGTRRPSVTIRNNTSQPFALSEVSINLPGVEVEVQELQANQFFTLTPVFPEGFELPVGERVQMRVKTSHQRQPEILVPVIQARQAIRPPSVPRPTPTNALVRPRASVPPPGSLARPRAPTPPPPPISTAPVAPVDR